MKRTARHLPQRVIRADVETGAGVPVGAVGPQPANKGTETESSAITTIEFFIKRVFSMADYVTIQLNRDFPDQTDFPEHLTHREASNYKLVSGARQMPSSATNDQDDSQG